MSIPALAFAAVAVPGSLAAAVVPPTPVSPGKADQIAVTASSCPSFSWSAVDQATGYELAIYRYEREGSSPRRILQRHFPPGASSWTPDLDSCLEPEAHHAWLVRATTAAGATSWSEAIHFATAARPGAERRIASDLAAPPTSRDVTRALEVIGRFLEAGGSLDELAAKSPPAGAGPSSPTPDARPVREAAAAGGAGFSVNGLGAVTASSFAGDGSALTAVDAEDLSCSSCVSVSELTFDPATQTELDIHGHQDGTVSNDLSIDNGRLFAPSGDGRVGIGTTSPSSKLDVVGNVEVTQVFKYSEPRAYQHWLGAYDFRNSTLSSADWVLTGAPSWRPANGTMESLVAPVHLPAGSTVTAIDCYYRDKEPLYDIEDLDISFRRVHRQNTLWTEISGVDYGAFPAFVDPDNVPDVASLSGLSATINNLDNSYYVIVFLDLIDPGGSTTLIEFFGCRVTFELLDVAF